MPWTRERIRRIRKALGESQEEFRKHFRVKIDTIQHWEQERGEPSGPAEVILEQLELQLGLATNAEGEPDQAKEAAPA